MSCAEFAEANSGEVGLALPADVAAPSSNLIVNVVSGELVVKT